MKCRSTHLFYKERVRNVGMVVVEVEVEERQTRRSVIDRVCIEETFQIHPLREGL
jgi:hypothetical protein